MAVDVVCGSYEGHVLGYSVPAAALAPGAAELQRKAAAPIFAEAQHDGCVRAVACGGNLMATGGTDNSIAVYNLLKRRSFGKLLQETGGSAVNCLAFHGQSHVISGCADGELSIWRTTDWECLLRMKGHKGSVLDVAIHPSGKVALSVGGDRKLMLWNLMTGKCSYTMALQESCQLVRWSPSGEEFALASPSTVRVFQLRSGAEIHALSHANSPLAMLYSWPKLLVTGGEGACLRVWDLSSGRCALELPNAHMRRIKALAEARVPDEVGVSTLFSACSDGCVKLWRFEVAEAEGVAPRLTMLFAIETRCRLTCLAVAAFSSPADGAVVKPTLKREKESTTKHLQKCIDGIQDAPSGSLSRPNEGGDKKKAVKTTNLALTDSQAVIAQRKPLKKAKKGGAIVIPSCTNAIPTPAQGPIEGGLKKKKKAKRAVVAAFPGVHGTLTTD